MKKTAKLIVGYSQGEARLLRCLACDNVFRTEEQPKDAKCPNCEVTKRRKST